MTAAIVLAAGRGQRMGANKALLQWQGRSFLAHVCERLNASGVIDEILVVVGAESERVTDEANRLGVRTIFNPNFARGLMSSLQVGLKSLDDSVSRTLVTLVDLPLIEVATIHSIYKSISSLARPSFQGQLGHPCLIGREYFAEILCHPPTDQGAQFLFQKHPRATEIIKVNDPGVCRDFDVRSELEVLNVSPIS